MHIKSVILILVIALLPFIVYGGRESSVIKISAPWFTNTSMEQLKIIRKSGHDVTEVLGMNGVGILPNKSFVVKGIEVPEQNAYISFWISPQWEGTDQRAHRLLNFGTDENGFLLEKSGKGMLRFVMNGTDKSSAVRYDISHWEKGEWYQVVVHWFTRNKLPAGINIYSDQEFPGRGGPEPIDGIIAEEGCFFNSQGLKDKTLQVGSSTSEAIFDEFFVAELPEPSSDFNIERYVYHSYYQTAPYQKVRIDPFPAKVAGDLRVVSGCQKQFGMEAFINGHYRQLIDFTVRYGQWAERDAKPLIEWSVSDNRIASVDSVGMVTGISPGKCKLEARFKGMIAGYDLEVIDVMRPDLSIGYVTRYPRYKFHETINKPAIGDTVTWAVKIFNFGFKLVHPGIPVTLTVTPDQNGNFVYDEKGSANIEHMKSQTKVALAPFESTVVEFIRIWTDEPFWLEFNVNDQDKMSEICMANNKRIRLNNARPSALGLHEGFAQECHQKKLINMVGSFGYVDYAWASIERLNVMLREAVYPTTSPNGVEESYSLEMTYEVGENREGSFYEEEYDYWDGAYPNAEKHIMNINSGMMHELGHMHFKLPDLYNYQVSPSSALIRDSKDKLEPFHFIKQRAMDPLSPSACGPYYDSFMNHCHMYLHPANAGKIQHFIGYRGERFWGAQSRLLPNRECGIQLFDIADEPLKNAHVLVYQVYNKDWQKWFVGNPKFIGHTDNNGIYIFTKSTHPNWDDPATDVVEHEIPVWNPFGTAREHSLYADVPFTPNVVETQGLLMVKVVSNSETEYHFVTDLDYQAEFYKGNTIAANVSINTNLQSSLVTDLLSDLNKDSEGLCKQEKRGNEQKNLIPVAITNIDSVSVKAGEQFSIDASKSFDPENKKLDFVWESRLFLENALDCQPVVTGTIPDASTHDFEVSLWVSDGMRLSERKIVKVHIIN